MMSDSIPVLRAKEVYRGKKLVQLKVWCEYCKGYHYHSTDEGHKVAHCHNENSPFLQTGYELQTAAKR